MITVLCDNSFSYFITFSPLLGIPLSSAPSFVCLHTPVYCINRTHLLFMVCLEEYSEDLLDLTFTVESVSAFGYSNEVYIVV
jgi:hypothetical protein